MGNREAVNKYQKTKKGVVSTMYQAQKNNSKRRGFGFPKYDINEFRKWVFSKIEFHLLYDKWILSGFEKLEKPSCDRIDDYEGYVLSNLKIVTWRENKYRSFRDRKNGINTKGAKAVIQMNMEGEIIKEFYSFNHAMRELNIPESTIRYSITSKKGHTHGFKFKYSEK